VGLAAFVVDPLDDDDDDDNDNDEDNTFDTLLISAGFG
jgi:hypothetical protein